MDHAGEIWIVRHGPTAWTATGQHTGRTDLPLTDDGRRAAAALKEKLAGRSFTLVLASPLARAYETCRLAGFADVARRCDDLMEWDYGRYDGLSRHDIRKQRPGWTIWDDGVVGGETLEQVAGRARRVISQVAGVQGDVALFAHAHLLRILAACWLELPPQAARYFELAPAAVGVLARNDGEPVIRKWNLT